MARSVIIGAVLVIIGVGAVWWYFQPKPPPSHQSPPPVVTEQIEDLQTEALQNQIEALQRQIDAIQAEIGKTPVLSLITKLENVQRQLEEIQGQKTAYQTQLDELQTRIESIYNQLVENLTQEIEHIQAQIGTDTILSLATKLDSVQKQMKAIQSANAQRPKTDQVIALNKRIEVRQTHIEQIYNQLVENLSQEIDRIQAKIDTNTILDLATELESVQKAMKVIGQHPKTSQKIEVLQTQIEQIYRQLVKEIQKPLEEIQAQVGQKTTVSLTTQLEKVQEQLWAILGQIGRLYGTQSLFYAQVSELQTQIEQIYAQLVDKINKQIEDIQKQPVRGTSAVISLTTLLADIQEPIDAVQKLLDKLYEIPQVIALQKQVEQQQTGIEQNYRRLVSDIKEQIEAMPADKCAEQKSLRSQIETLQTQIETIQQRIDKSVRSPEMAALKTQLDDLDKEIMAGLTEISSCSCVNEVPKCLSSVSAEMQKKLPLSCVPTMQDRSIPDYLHNWIKGVDKITETEFFVMRREVKVGEFQDYVETLDKGQKEQLGTLWRKEYNGEVLPDENPVASVPWWAAKGYADWLSKETGCPLTLPTYNQWVAAAISYANPEKAVIRDKQQFLGLKPQQRSEKQASGNLLPFLYPEKTSDGVLDLLGNLREWSIDSSCPDESYHYILGGDYNTWQDNIGGEPICEMGLSDMVGFRLILRENK